MDSSRSAIPIEPRSLEQFTEHANRLLSAVKWAPKQELRHLLAGPAGDAPQAPGWRESAVHEAVEQEVSVLRTARKVSKDALLLSEEMNHVLTVVRQGLRLGMHLSKIYTQFSGLDQLIALNSRGGLIEEQKAEFRSKYQSASAIAVFVAAYYAAWELGSYRSEEVGGIALEFQGVPEVSLQNPVRALDCLVFYYGAYLEHSAAGRGSLECVKLTLLYFQAAAEEIARRAESLQYLEPFTGNTYTLPGTEFNVDGFNLELSKGEVSIEFNRVSLEDIVGNRDAKHFTRRLAERLLCYDPAAKRNPMLDLGGFSGVQMGYGEPGTGKSMLISALATLLHDYCRQLGVPFLFWPMPDTVVSTFQGGSAERMMNWMRVLRDTGKIIYAPIDDAENNLEERTRQGVSAGVREVIAVFLRNTEGAYASQHGNFVIQLFTNIPDQIDKAVLSRVQARTYIGGAQTWQDFIDQDYLWLRKHREIDPKFVNMKDPRDYQYLSAQSQLASLAAIAEQTGADGDARLKAIFDRVEAGHDPSSHRFFAELFAEVKREFPFFTSRDLRNIQRAIDSRIMDFDLPPEWFQDSEMFYQQSYDRKRSMIVELMRANMKGLSFAEIRLQETRRYLETMIDIAETGRERQIAEMADQIRLRRAAEQRTLVDAARGFDSATERE